MQTIIMTVGTSLLTNPDRNLPDAEKRPWIGQQSIGDRLRAIEWIENKVTNDWSCLETISAETNTLYHLDTSPKDKIILLHSDTPKGLECAEVLKDFLLHSLNQENVQLYKLPGINYDSDESWSALEKMAEQLQKLLNQHQNQGNITLAATGGFKAQTMIMALVGNIFKVPVCYIHEAFKGLIYLPYLSPSGVPDHKFTTASLRESSVDRNKVINVQESKKHHRPKIWKKLEKILQKIPWINYVRFDENAFTAPRNGVRKAQRGTNVLWVHLYESEKARMGISIDTTALTTEEQEQAALELRERLGRLI